ncbi:MAG: YkgJ family cysteine cluster protein [Pseudomonadota bacterium]
MNDETPVKGPAAGPSQNEIPDEILKRLQRYQVMTGEAQERADAVAVKLAPRLRELPKPVDVNSANARTRGVLAAIEEINAAATGPVENKIECRKGCGFCCHQLLLVKVGEAFVMRQALKRLKRKARREITQRARAQLQSLLRSGYRGVQDWKQKEVMTSLGNAVRQDGLPCPFLDDAGQACMIYEDRAVPCRSAFAFERDLCKSHYGYKGKPPKAQYFEFGVIHPSEQHIPNDGSLIPACEVVLNDSFDSLLRLFRPQKLDKR